MLLRHNVVLLEQNELVTAPLQGRVYRIRPSDGDTMHDLQQRWWVLVDLAREGDGVVGAIVSSSFDGTTWFPVASLSAKRQAAQVRLLDLAPFGPLLRVETQGEEGVPPHRVVVRLASDGPFVAIPD
jgi:hypothetical protein